MDMQPNPARQDHLDRPGRTRPRLRSFDPINIRDRDRQERRFSRPILAKAGITAPHMNHVGIQTVPSSDSGDRNTGDSRFTDHLLLECQAVSSTLPHPNTRIQLSIYLEMDNWTPSRQERLPQTLTVGQPRLVIRGSHLRNSGYAGMTESIKDEAKKQIEFENLLIHQRLTWLGTFLGFLFAAVALSWGNEDMRFFPSLYLF